MCVCECVSVCVCVCGIPVPKEASSVDRFAKNAGGSGPLKSPLPTKLLLSWEDIQADHLDVPASMSKDSLLCDCRTRPCRTQLETLNTSRM